MRKLLLTLGLLVLASSAWAQAPVFCPTRPLGDSSNACASTAFVQANGGGGGGGMTALPNNQIYVGNASNIATAVAVGGDCTIVAAGTLTCTKTNGTLFGSAATIDTGTSGAKIPLLSTANTWTLAQTFTAAPVFTDAAGSRTALGLGTMATQAASAVAITGGTITGMGTPSATTDVANKAYVDATATGLHSLTAATLGTAAPLPANTYNNGASGVGATLTGNANGALTVDSVLTTATIRVVVKDEVATANNGVYSVTTVGDGSNPYVLTRVTDFDTAAEMLAGSYIFITAGTVNANRAYVLAATTTTVGTTSVVWNLFSILTTQPWTVSGSDVYYNTGNVGIKNTAPATALHVGAGGGIDNTIRLETTSGNTGALEFYSSGNNVISAVKSLTSTNNQSGIIALHTALNGVLAERVRVDISGNVGIGTTTPAFDSNPSKFFAVNNPTAHNFSEIGIGANATTIGDYAGGLSFFNSSLGAADKRIAFIFAQTAGATNGARMEFYTYNAGTYGLRMSLSQNGLTNITGDLAINADFVAGSNITSALQLALNTYDKVTLPCGTFLITSTINFIRAGQQLRGCGREKTILQLGGALSGWFISISGIADTGISDLTIDLANLSSNGGCALAHGPAIRTKWHNVGCIHMSNGGVGGANQSNGFYWNSSDNTAANAPRWSELKDCYLEDSVANDAAYNAHPIGMNFADYVTISGCTSKDINDGVNTQGSSYITITGNVFEGTGSGTTGFAGIRCSNNSFNITVTGNVVKDMPRGLFLGECDSSTFVGNSIINCQYQCILVSADAIGNSRYGTISGNSLRSGCLSSACNYPIEFVTSGGGTNTGYTINGNAYLKAASPVSSGMIIMGVGTSAVCTGNSSDVGGTTC